jgi:tRNA(fMet)-specific endonuclease VapC
MKLVDTDLLIDLQREYVKGEPGPAMAFLRAHEGVALAISTVSVLEFLEGYGHPRAGERLLEAYVRLPVTDSVARRGSRLRRTLRAEGQMIGDFDVLIAATALDAGVPLVTANVTHFKRVQGLEVETYRPA